LVRDVPAPDLVVFLQAPADVIRKRLKQRARRDPTLTVPDLTYLRELTDAFNHFFFHYTATPLLVVETSQLNLAWPDEAIDEILRQIQSMTPGTQYYVLR